MKHLDLSMFSVLIELPSCISPMGDRGVIIRLNDIPWGDQSREWHYPELGKYNSGSTATSKLAGAKMSLLYAIHKAIVERSL